MKTLTRDTFEDILNTAVEKFGYQYVWDLVKSINAEVNFDGDDAYRFQDDLEEWGEYDE